MGVIGGGSVGGNSSNNSCSSAGSSKKREDLTSLGSDDSGKLVRRELTEKTFPSQTAVAHSYCICCNFYLRM